MFSVAGSLGGHDKLLSLCSYSCMLSCLCRCSWLHSQPPGLPSGHHARLPNSNPTHQTVSTASQQHSQPGLQSLSVTLQGYSSKAVQAHQCSSPHKAGGVWEGAAAALDNDIGCIVACAHALLYLLACHQLRQEATHKGITCTGHGTSNKQVRHVPTASASCLQKLLHSCHPPDSKHSWCRGHAAVMLLSYC